MSHHNSKVINAKLWFPKGTTKQEIKEYLNDDNNHAERIWNNSDWKLPNGKVKLVVRVGKRRVMVGARFESGFEYILNDTGDKLSPHWVC